MNSNVKILTPDKLFSTLAFIAISSFYFVSAVHAAITTSFWMDEVLALTAAERPNISGVVAVIWAGTDYCPPTYHILLHAVAQFSHSALMYRLLSILAIFLTSIIVLQIARRYCPPPLPVLAYGLTLGSILFSAATLARPYAFMALCLAASLNLWERVDEKGPAIRIFAMWFMFALSLSLHFYGFISVAAVAIAELLWLASGHEFRWKVWLPVVLSFPVELAWAPYAIHLARFSGLDSASNAFHARPTLPSFFQSLVAVLCNSGIGLLILVLIFISWLCVRALRSSGPRSSNAPQSAGTNHGLPIGKFEILIVTLATVPFIVFAFSLVTKNYATRYASPAALFFGLAIVLLVRELPASRYVAYALILFSIYGIYTDSHRHDAIAEVTADMERPRDAIPVVVISGKSYIELMRAAAPQTRSSLVYLKNPSDFASPDATGEHEVIHLEPFNPAYHLEERDSFTSVNPRFYVLVSDEQPLEEFAPWLMDKEFAKALVWKSSDSALFLVNERSATRNEQASDGK